MGGERSTSTNKSDYLSNYVQQYKVYEEIFQQTKDKLATARNLPHTQAKNQIENVKNKARLGSIIDCLLNLEFCRKDSEENKKEINKYDDDNDNLKRLNLGTKSDIK